MNKHTWTDKNIPRLDGLRVVITGATGGLGRIITKELAHLGAKITLLCRNKSLAEDLIAEILSSQNKANIDFIELDLGNKPSVDRCIEELKKYNGIDILINNAGVYNVPLKTLDSGYNNIFQINFLYTYYLTKKLLPELKKRPNSTCITLGSVAHNYSVLDKSDIDFTSRKKPSLVYGNSKRFLMFSLYELFKSTSVNLAIVHPGVTLTNMTNHYPRWINWLVKIGIKLFFPPPTKAIRSILAGTKTPTPDKQWIGPRFFNVWGNPRVSKLSTCDETESAQIFAIAEELTNKL